VEVLRADFARLPELLALEPPPQPAVPEPAVPEPDIAEAEPEPEPAREPAAAGAQQLGLF
jgi:hypothetical protein